MSVRYPPKHWKDLGIVCAFNPRTQEAKVEVTKFEANLDNTIQS